MKHAYILIISLFCHQVFSADEMSTAASSDKPETFNEYVTEVDEASIEY